VSADRPVPPAGGGRPWFTATGLLAAGLLTLIPGASAWGEWTRAVDPPTFAAMRRIFTCHFAHFGAAHLLWNALALALTGPLLERRARGPLIAATLLAAVAIPLTLPFLAPGLACYRGASGLASTWFTLALFEAWRTACDETSGPLLLVVAAGFAAKMVVEAITGASLFVGPDARFVDVPAAHWVGTACAGLVELARRLATARHSTKRTKAHIPPISSAAIP
jgi:membrane associated rhomboid family serine protease